MINGGQSCIAAKKFNVEKEVIKEFTQLFIKQIKTYQMGDPSGSSTNLGPMAREDLRDEVHEQVKASVRAGAECVLGGRSEERRVGKDWRRRRGWVAWK